MQTDETYVATAAPDKAHKDIALLIITDVLGHKFNNVQLIADQFAANGYNTYVPDVFQGDPIPLNRPEGFNIFDWLQGKNSGKPHTVEYVEPVTKALIKHIREETGAKRVGGIGYCFGAKYVIRHLSENGGLDVGYVAHPSFVEESELEATKGPLSIAAACKFLPPIPNPTPITLKHHTNTILTLSKDHDSIFPPEKRHKSEEILVKIDVPYQINLYSHVEHGFAVRADLSKKPIKFAKEQAFIQAVTWFDEYLK
jgi:dienelactone hydrolase